VNVVPSDLTEHLWRSRALQHGQRFARHAFAREPAGSRIVGLRNAAAFAVGAGAIAAEHQLIAVALEKFDRESGVARQGIVPRICREVAIQVGVIGEEFVGNPAGLNRAGRVGDIVGLLRADVGPKSVGMANEARLRIGLQHSLETLKTRAEDAFSGRVRDFLKMNQDWHVKIGGE